MSKLVLKSETQNEWEDLMQEGYTHSMKRNSVEAVRVWTELWNRIRDVLKADDNISMEDIDGAFHGMQSIYNWTTDFEMELGNASKKDKSFAQTRIEFCKAYITKYRDKSESNLEGMKWALCESYFDLGEIEEGERLFQKYLEESPTSGWGWIGWSDQYSLFAKKHNKDNDKAIQILEKALEIEGLQDRFYALERLEDLYMKVGRQQEATEVRKHLDQMKAKNAVRPKVALPPMIKAVPVTSVKIGRNDPCTCGSGQKYKKCCGR
ncbi:SEC-C motif-containing protein [Paenibacillus tianmuensis]|uniref:SEC-C motif-containing protein n=1 Tax=Paenibacillus tianmuensis TaxID=624147 RepID=A0A1G4TFR9_9BACL|nr:SEC-C metal-binding domain-containing protein [Paenibacillus tianmuensis]SCW80273.1 SEC-C motif-containing protein [Paenibacillus tianmuensis]